MNDDDLEQEVVDGIVYSSGEDRCRIINPRTNEEIPDENAKRIRKKIDDKWKKAIDEHRRKQLKKKGTVAPSQWSLDVVPYFISVFTSDMTERLAELVINRSAKRWGYRMIDEEVQIKSPGQVSPIHPSNHWVDVRWTDNSNFISSGALAESCLSGCIYNPLNSRYILKFNNSSNWDADHNGSNRNLELTATHEFGHIWGESVHTECTDCIMNAGIGNHNIPVVLKTGDPGDMSLISTNNHEPDNVKWINNTDGWKDRQIDFEALDLVQIEADRLTRLGLR